MASSQPLGFSPEAAAKIPEAKGFPHYDLSREEKKDKLASCSTMTISAVIRRGVVKQSDAFQPACVVLLSPHVGCACWRQAHPAELFR